MGAYLGGPFKIVHHTTESSRYDSARDAVRRARSDPHFTVDAVRIYQHIDTGRAARSLRNRAGGVQTNRDSAVQIEVVGFAARAKDPATLANVARLCRWVEQEHGVPQVWPNGPPRYSSSGRDPGGHNRNARNWDTRGGHYGHSQVPENIHWDPGYTPAEVAIVTPNAAPGLPAAALSLASLQAAEVDAATALAWPAGKALRLPAEGAVGCAVFISGDHVVLRLRERQGTAIVGEHVLDNRDGWVLGALFTRSARKAARSLVVQALVNGEPARIVVKGRAASVRSLQTGADRGSVDDARVFLEPLPRTAARGPCP